MQLIYKLVVKPKYKLITPLWQVAVKLESHRDWVVTKEFKREILSRPNIESEQCNALHSFQECKYPVFDFRFSFKICQWKY